MAAKKSWLEQMDTPVIEIKAVGSAEPVRGHSHFKHAFKLLVAGGFIDRKKAAQALRIARGTR
jgi:hypothetical protein